MGRLGEKGRKEEAETRGATFFDDHARLLTSSVAGRFLGSRLGQKEWERVSTLIIKGEEKLQQVISMETSLRTLIKTFDDPWQELAFSQTTARDKGFTPEEDRYLLCWTHKYGHGQWEVRMAPAFENLPSALSKCRANPCFAPRRGRL